jgi:hypothetical protein
MIFKDNGPPKQVRYHVGITVTEVRTYGDRTEEMPIHETNVYDDGLIEALSIGVDILRDQWDRFDTRKRNSEREWNSNKRVRILEMLGRLLPDAMSPSMTLNRAMANPHFAVMRDEPDESLVTWIYDTLVVEKEPALPPEDDEADEETVETPGISWKSLVDKDKTVPVPVIAGDPQSELSRKEVVHMVTGKCSDKGGPCDGEETGYHTCG